MTGNILHHRIADPHNIHKHAMMSFEQRHLGLAHKEAHDEKKRKKAELEKELIAALKKVEAEKAAGGGGTDGSSIAEERLLEEEERMRENLAGLNCEDHGGPLDMLEAGEMVYWRDVPSDAEFVSPIKKNDGKKRYLTFEPDGEFCCRCRCSIREISDVEFAFGGCLLLCRFVARLSFFTAAEFRGHDIGSFIYIYDKPIEEQ